MPSDEEGQANRQEGMRRFLHDDGLTEPSPMMDGRFDMKTVRETAELYQELLDSLMSTPPEQRTDDEEELIDKIIRKIGELFRYEELMLAMGAVALGDTSGHNEHRRIASELSLDIMGGIDQPVFDSLVNELIDTAKKSHRPEACELLAMLPHPETEPAAVEIVGLKDETIEIVNQDVRQLYPGLDDMIERASGSPVPVEQAVDICNELISKTDLPAGWKAELDGGTSAHTDIKNKTVYYGRGRDNFPSGLAAIGVAFHEAIVHGGRGEGPGGLAFEEGLATCLEQVITGVKRVPGVQYYLSIGLQAGADRQGEMRSYRETFEIMWRREVLLMEQAGKEIDIEKARSNAQRQVHRTRRGGAIDTRDSSYFLGAQKAANWLNMIADLPEPERQAKLKHVLSVRYDPTDPDHQKYDMI